MRQSEGERIDSLPNGWPIVQHCDEFKFTLDAVLLAAFPLLRRKAKVIELGVGTGAVSLLLAARSDCEISGLDINPRVTALFSRSIELNNLSGRLQAVCGDVCQVRDFFPAGQYDMVVSNPPYRKTGHGRLRSGGSRAACHETLGQTGDFIKAARYLLKYSGKLALVQLPERLPEILATCLANGLEPKRLQLVYPKQGKAPSLFLLEAVYGAHPGLKVLPPLFVYGEDGSYSKELLACYELFSVMNE